MLILHAIEQWGLSIDISCVERTYTWKTPLLSLYIYLIEHERKIIVISSNTYRAYLLLSFLNIGVFIQHGYIGVDSGGQPGHAPPPIIRMGGKTPFFPPIIRREF